MNNIIDNIIKVFNDAGRTFCDFSLNMFVQVSVLIVVLLIIDILIRKRVQATFRYCIWMLVFIKLILPPALSLPTGIGNWFGEYFVVSSENIDRRAENIEQESSISTESFGTEFSPRQVLNLQNFSRTDTPRVTETQEVSTAPQVAEPDITNANSITWQGGIFLVWLVGVLVLSVLLIQRIFFVKGLIAQSEPAKNRLLEILDECSKQLGIRRNIQMKLSHNASSPAVCGLFNPVILIPANLLSKISNEKFKAILIHELSHIKRNDLLVNCAQTILQILYFYNPLLWLANSIVRKIREQAVDEMVLVALGAEAKSYTNTLIDVAEMAFSRPALSLRLVGVVESKKALSERIKHILSRPIPKSAKLGFMGMLVILVSAFVLLPMAGQEVTNKQRMQNLVENWFKNNYLDISERKTIEWGEPQKNKDGSYSIAYKYEAKILNKDKIINNDIFSFTENGEFVSVKKVEGFPINAEASGQFTATLPNGVTVELLGLCHEPVKGAKWWKPDGSEIPKPTFETSTRTPPMGDIPARYTFLAKAQGGEDISMKAKIYEGFGNLTKVAQDGSALCFVKSPDNSKPHHEDAFEKGPIEIGIAQGQWIKGRGTVGELLHIPREYLIGSSDQIVIQPPRADNAEPNMVTNIWASVTSHDYEFKLVCKLKDGSMRESEQAYFQSANIIETGGLHNSAINTFPFVFDGLTYDQIADYELFYRKFDFVRFNNVAFKPSIKTEVQIVSKNGLATEVTENSENDLNINVEQPKLFTLSDNALMSLDDHSGSTARIIDKRDTAGPGVEFDIYFPPGGDSLSYNSSRTRGKAALTYIDLDKYIGYSLKFTLLNVKSDTPNIDKTRLGVGANIGSPGRYKPAFLYLTEKNKTVVSSTGLDSVEIQSFDYLGFTTYLLSKDFINTNGVTLTLKIEAVSGADIVEPTQKTDKVLSEADKTNLFSMFITIGTTCESAASEIDKGDLETAKKLCEPIAEISTKMLILAKSTEFETIVTAGAKQFDLMHQALKEGNIESAKTYMKVIMQLGNNSSQMFKQLIGTSDNSNTSMNKQGGTAAEDIKENSSEVGITSEQGSRNLQQMIDSAKPETTIIIPNGKYTQPVEITKSLILKGQSRKDCILEITDDKPAIFINTKSKGKVTLENMTIKWQLATSDQSKNPYAIAAKDSVVEIKNCSVEPLGNSKRSPEAVRSIGFSDMTIDTCRFEGFEYTVCFGEGSKGTIQNSLIMNSSHQGISLYEGAAVKIIGNVITGSKYHGVRSTGGTLDMKDNLIIKNDNRGVYLGNKSANGTIENNVIIGNGSGISGFSQSKVTIENNVIADDGYAGIDMRDSCKFTIRDNIIKGNESGLTLFKESGKNNNEIFRNTFWQNKTETQDIDKHKDSIASDPLFNDAENGDFSLKLGPVQEAKQGLKNTEIFISLWEIWKNRADKNEPFANITSEQSHSH